LEIALLESEREKFMKEIEGYKIPLLEKHNQELKHHLKELQERVDLLRHTVKILIKTWGKK